MPEPKIQSAGKIKTSIINDFGKKFPISGKKAPDGAFNDFRVALSYPLTAGNWGSLAFDSGAWVATVLKEPNASVVKWWGGLTYKNPDWLNFYVTPRFYFGVSPKNDTGLYSLACFIGIRPAFYQFSDGTKLGSEFYFYLKPYENYFSGPTDHLETYYASAGLTFDFGLLQLKAAAQLWTTSNTKIDNSENTTNHARLFLGTTFYF